MVEQEIFIHPDGMELVKSSLPHEAGHAEVASHFGGIVLGIAVTFQRRGLVPMTIHALPNNLPVGDSCTVFAAGAAGEKMQFGTYSQESASQDQRDIERLAGSLPFEPFVERAANILMERKARFDRKNCSFRIRGCPLVYRANLRHEVHPYG